jgi:hypothetical protein
MSARRHLGSTWPDCLEMARIADAAGIDFCHIGETAKPINVED